jgi:hypothetical protein
MVIDYENLFAPSCLKHFKMGGARPPPNIRKNTAIRSKCPSNIKTRNFLYLANLAFLSKNNSTTSFKTHENGGAEHFKTFKMYHN